VTEVFVERYEWCNFDKSISYLLKTPTILSRISKIYKSFFITQNELGEVLLWFRRPTLQKAKTFAGFRTFCSWCVRNSLANDPFRYVSLLF